MSPAATSAAVGATTPKLSLTHSHYPKTISLLPPSIISCLYSSHSTSLKPLNSLSSHVFCHAFPSNSQNFQFATSNFEDEDEDEEQVIGDCLIFEDGVFEDPYIEEELNPQISSVSETTQKPKSRQNKPEVIEPQNLIPEKWNSIVEEINLTKKERRKIAQEMEFGQKVVKRKMINVNMQEYLRLREEKLSQLNPVVLDDPPSFRAENEGSGDDADDDGVAKHRRETVDSRVEPKNPRWAVYGRGLDDITEFFNSGNYQPSEKSDGRQGQVLFTKEEKALMNAKRPRLAAATSEKWLPLHTLAASGEFYLVNTLLKHDVDINAADQDGLTALHKAITCKKQAIINYLLRESADPFSRDKDGATLMHYAVRTASSQIIKTLLLHNVDINLQDNDGWSPLHLAVQARRTDVVRLLLMKGADKTLKNKDNLTALELCLYSGNDTKTYELIKLLKQLPRRHR
ncbi:ankyrin repeat domain-containing protein, chloroplastic-like [Chenopodium quinoa]|uniref:ankyrin repeat domain-containing protein, chloroplastic-like n=1 Tax=Chenopodium quinoa TaxID=63459 RepID=UPI000B782DB5|nr:ankyrin repeat domain-containing protein, chloroplastic-like [Chenopodium quinoa]